MHPIFLLSRTEALEALDLCRAAVAAGEYGFKVDGKPDTFCWSDLNRARSDHFRLLCGLVLDHQIREMATGVAAE